MGNTWLNKPGGPLYDPIRQAATKALFKPNAPATPPVPLPTPPVEPNNAASLQAEQAMMQQQARRRSISSTIYAGAGEGATASGAPSTGSSRTKTG